MYDNINVALLGGDRRQIYTAAYLAAAGYTVNVCGISRERICEHKLESESKKEYLDKLICKDNMPDAVCNASIIILPVPASGDGVRVNAPLDDEGALSDVKLVSVVKTAPEGSVIIGGKIPSAIVSAAEERGIKTHDILELEPFEIANAYTTAEAALSIAMNSLMVNVSESRIAVT